MTYRSNTFKFITKGLMHRNIISLGVATLLSGCLTSSHQGLPELSSVLNPMIKALVDPKNTQNDVNFLLGKGRRLELEGYPYSLFIASQTKETFIFKLPVEARRHDPVAQQDHDTALPIQYDFSEHARIIKIDDRLRELLVDQSSDISQCSTGQEHAWDKMELCYKKPISAHPIFTEDGIRPSREFTNALYHKLRSTSSSTSSIRCSLDYTTYNHLEGIGFLLVKDKSGLANLIKHMLEGGAKWGTKAEVAATKDYIICPAAVTHDGLQFDARDVKQKLQDSDLRLEAYPTAYCYFKYAEYDRLITLGNMNPLVCTMEQEVDYGSPEMQASTQLPPNTEDEVRTEEEDDEVRTEEEEDEVRTEEEEDEVVTKEEPEIKVNVIDRIIQFAKKNKNNIDSGISTEIEDNIRNINIKGIKDIEQYTQNAKLNSSSSSSKDILNDEINNNTIQIDITNIEPKYISQIQETIKQYIIYMIRQYMDLNQTKYMINIRLAAYLPHSIALYKKLNASNAIGNMLATELVLHLKKIQLPDNNGRVTPPRKTRRQTPGKAISKRK